jgi:hypothetical protein
MWRHNNVKSRLLLFAICALLTGILIGCSGSTAEATGSNEPKPKAGQFEGADDKADTAGGVSAKGGTDDTASEL